MPRAKRICPRPGCTKPVNKRYCTAHEAEYERNRGNSNQRGYGASHQQARAQVAPQVRAGHMPCARCGQPIEPGQDWHLDHNDDRSGYIGPSHAQCNTRAGGKRAHEG